MIISGTERIDNIFDKDSILFDLCDKYFIIERNLKEKKRPVHEENIIKAFKADYNIELTTEEAWELKDFCQNGDYEIYSMDKFIEEQSKITYLGY